MCGVPVGCGFAPRCFVGRELSGESSSGGECWARGTKPAAKIETRSRPEEGRDKGRDMGTREGTREGTGMGKGWIDQH